MSAPLDQSRNVLHSELRADLAPVETPSPQGGAPSDLSFEGLYERWFEDVSRWVQYTQILLASNEAFYVD